MFHTHTEKKTCDLQSGLRPEESFFFFNKKIFYGVPPATFSWNSNSFYQSFSTHYMKFEAKNALQVHEPWPWTMLPAPTADDLTSRNVFGKSALVHRTKGKPCFLLTQKRKLVTCSLAFGQRKAFFLFFTKKIFYGAPPPLPAPSNIFMKFQ